MPGSRPPALAAPPTDGAAVDALVGRVTGFFGRIDILVNDAAYNKAIPFAELDTLTLGIWEKRHRQSPTRAGRALRLLRKAADKDDCADMAVAMCRSETMTGQTAAIDSGRLFH